MSEPAATLIELLGSEIDVGVFEQLRNRPPMAILAPPRVQALLKLHIDNPRIAWCETLEQAAAQTATVVVFAATVQQEQAALQRLAAAGRRVRGFYSFLMPIAVATRPFSTYYRDEIKPPPQPQRAERAFAIVCSARTGSTRLCTLLIEAGLGFPAEHLRTPAAIARRAGLEPRRLLQLVSIWSSRGGTFGTKFLVDYFAKACGGEFGAAQRLARSFAEDGLVMFRLDRDPIDRAVSHALALTSQVWHVDKVQLPQARAYHAAMRVSDETLRRALYGGAAEAAYMDRVFEVPEARRLDYAQLIAAPQAMTAAVAVELGAAPGSGAGPISPAVPIGTDNPAYQRLRERACGLVLADDGEALEHAIVRGRELTGLDVSELRRWAELQAALEQLRGAAEGRAPS